jgi:hypothetical protein
VKLPFEPSSVLPAALPMSVSLLPKAATVVMPMSVSALLDPLTRARPAPRSTVTSSRA